TAYAHAARDAARSTPRSTRPPPATRRARRDTLQARRRIDSRTARRSSPRPRRAPARSARRRRMRSSCVRRRAAPRRAAPPRSAPACPAERLGRPWPAVAPTDRAARRPTATRAACRPSPAPCSNRGRASAHRLPGQRVALDLLVEVGARHVERARRLGHVPVELAQLGEQKGSLGGVFELLEGLALEKRAEPRLLGIARADQPRHVVGRDPRTGGQDEQTLNSV